jgi:hypothetical protein
MYAEAMRQALDLLYFEMLYSPGIKLLTVLALIQGTVIKRCILQRPCYWPCVVRCHAVCRSVKAIATFSFYGRFYSGVFFKTFFEQIFTAPLKHFLPPRTGGNQPPGQGGLLWGAGAGLVVK